LSHRFERQKNIRIATLANISAILLRCKRGMKLCKNLKDAESTASEKDWFHLLLEIDPVAT
jgi:hypothetical protein